MNEHQRSSAAGPRTGARRTAADDPGKNRSGSPETSALDTRPQRHSDQSGDRTSHSTDAGGNGGFIERVREKASAQLNTQKDRATDGIGNVAQAVRNATRELRDQRHETVAEYIERSADQLERLASRLKNKDVGDLLRDAQSLARRQPALFIGSAFTVGLLAARFLKSSPTRTDSASGGSWQRYASGEPSHGTAAATGASRFADTPPRPGSPLSGLADARTDREQYPNTERS